jgi:purine-binding chemotaxis protein CheW
MVSEATATAARPPRADLGSAANEAGGSTSWLLCRAGAHLYGMPLEHVIESMRALPIDPVSGAPACVRGLSIIRGRPVAVVDPGLLLDDRPTDPNRLVTIRVGRRTVALVAEEVVGIRAVTADQSRELPPLLKDAAGDRISAIATLDDELLFLLRAAKIVPEEVIDRLEVAGAPT